MSIIQNIKDIGRFDQIINVLFKNEFGYFLKKAKLKQRLELKHRIDTDKFKEKATQPYRIRKVFEQLGGGFIKLGQLLSLRPDLIPREFCDEFAKLQDQVPAFSSEEARKIIETELKKPIKDLFKEFNDKPTAAASIGQVHEAILKTGEKVIVKVQRPDVRNIFATDVDILYHLARLIEHHYHPVLFNPVEIIKEFENYTKKELDYSIEAKNVDKFYLNFKGNKNVVIPRVFWDYTTSKVLTLEKLEGRKLKDIKKSKAYNTKKINKLIVDSVLRQIFKHGIFHADPHPGNILVVGKNKIAFLDFGIVGFLDDDTRDKITELFIGMIKGDLDLIAQALISLKVIEVETNIDILKKDLYEEFREYHSTNIQQMEFSHVFGKIIMLSKRHGIKLPSNFVLFGKSLATLQGVSLELDPSFNLVKASLPFVRKLVKEKTSPEAIVDRVKESALKVKNYIVNLPEQTSTFLRRVRQADVALKRIDTDLRNLTVEMDRSSNRITFGLIITALVISGALMLDYTTNFIIKGIPGFSFLFFAAAGFLFFILMLSIWREKKR